MIFLMDFFELRLVDVGVDLCRGDTGMTQHLLDVPQVGSARQQMGRETMPQRVRTNGVSYCGTSSIFFYQFPDRLAS